LTVKQEAILVAFRKHTLLPLDDCLYALEATIPQLTRSSLHRCLERHGISRLPEMEGTKPRRQKFDRYPIGYFHLDLAEVRTAEGKLYLFVAIDQLQVRLRGAGRTRRHASRGHFSGSLDRRGSVSHSHGADRQRHPVRRSAKESQRTNRPAAWPSLRPHLLVAGHRPSPHQPNHPWTNGQVERRNRTIKEAPVKRYHYDSHHPLKAHLDDFVAAYNFARRLKSLRGLTPYESICKLWPQEPERFTLYPTQQMPELCILENFHG
jgi:hypothetical protein